MTRKTVLLLSGLDPTGGAGLLADVSVMKAEKVHPLGVPTALTVQTGKKVTQIERVSRDYFRRSLEALLDTFTPHGVKIGMVSSPGIAREIFRILRDLQLPFVVWDPVLHSTFGTPLTPGNALKILEKILPHCTLVTPNRRELTQLSSLLGLKGRTKESLGRQLSEKSATAILVTGGEGRQRGMDCLFHQGSMAVFPGRAIQKKDFHGTGCALSSMILARLVKGDDLQTAIVYAKEKLEEGLLGGFRSLDGRWFIGG
ncbi:MAG: hypothetical protein GTN70_07070 [Deltaproteobacteria bacterium]|nr:hypothetical protein [Deltaproteobacteria bacterium]NIS77457.1 hypothetical protein [Deltaproteobacteria bacterium]